MDSVASSQNAAPFEEWQRLREANRLLFDEMMSKPRWAKLRAGTP
jgi:hypothetical protein